MNIKNKISNKSKEFLYSVENSEYPLGGYLLSFFFVTLIRNFLEIFSDFAEPQFIVFYHFDLSFLWLASAFVILIHYLSGECINKVIKVVLTCFTIILLPPIFDLIITGGAGRNMTYLLPGYHDNLLHRYLTFWGDFNMGATPGIRLEVLIVMMGAFFYVRSKGKSVFVGILASLLSYTLIFTFGILPFFLKFINELFSSKVDENSYTYVKMFLLGFSVTLPWIYFLRNKHYLIELLKDLRWLRVTHYLIMFFVGVKVSYTYYDYKHSIDLDSTLSLLFVIISFIFACIYSIIINNINDYNIDSISNRNRPSIKKSIPQGHYLKVKNISFIMAVVYSSAVSFSAMYFILLFIGIYYIYSSWPFRLKRIFLFSKFLIALNSLVMVLFGINMVSGKNSIPLGLTCFILVGFTLVINFIDIKDSEGDKASNILTLPNLIGVVKAKKLIGLFFILLYPLSLMIINYRFFVPYWMYIFSGVAGALTYIFMTKEQYDERYIFLSYLSAIIFLCLYF